MGYTEINFRKFKFTNNFFYRSVESASIEVHKDKFIVSIFPYFTYSGTYLIHSIEKNVFNETIYKTMKIIEGIDEIDLINPYNEIYISISKDLNKAKIFKRNLDGIILKK